MMDLPSWGFHQSRGSSAGAGRLACASGEGEKRRGDLVRKGMDMLATRPHVYVQGALQHAPATRSEGMRYNVGWSHGASSMEITWRCQS
jgi:hypothetical protein